MSGINQIVGRNEQSLAQACRGMSDAFEEWKGGVQTFENIVSKSFDTLFVKG